MASGIGSFITGLLGASGIGAPATQASNLIQAQRFGDEWVDEVLDLIHDTHRLATPEAAALSAQTAASELRELAGALEAFSMLEAAQRVRGPGSLNAEIKEARRAVKQQCKNVSRALVGAPLWTAPPAPNPGPAPTPSP